MPDFWDQFLKAEQPLQLGTIGTAPPPQPPPPNPMQSALQDPYGAAGRGVASMAGAVAPLLKKATPYLKAAWEKIAPYAEQPSNVQWPALMQALKDDPNIDPVSKVTGVEVLNQIASAGTPVGLAMGMVGLGPVKRAKKATEALGEVASMGQTALRAAPAEAKPVIRAFHGSPHDFDQFSMAKIGTGEGAQAYGHGLYYAESPATAETYRAGLAGHPEIKSLRIGNKIVGQHNGFDYSPRGNSTYENIQSSLIEDLLVDQNALVGQPPQEIQAHVLKVLDGKIADYAKEWPEAVKDAERLRKDLARRGNVSLTMGERPGKSYEVAIKADPSHFLDWDAPLSKQPEAVRGFIGYKGRPTEAETQEVFAQAMKRGVDPTTLPEYKALEARMDAASQLERDYPTGEAVYQDLRMKAQPEYVTREQWESSGASASQKLRESGIPGIKYLDAQSRNSQGWHVTPPNATVSGKWMVKSRDYNSKGLMFDTEAEARAALADKVAGETRNYVVFDDKLVEILRKYGLMLPAAGLAGAAAKEKR